MNFPYFDAIKVKFSKITSRSIEFCKSTIEKIKLKNFKLNDLKNKKYKYSGTKLNKLIHSAVALSLMLILLVTTTLSWLMSNFTTDITTEDNNEFITIAADAGLEMNYGDQDNNQGTINIENVKLTECSSVDGRNFFFPLSEYSSKGDKEFVDNVNTNDLVFREGTANDRNKNYISVNFSLSAQNETDIWLSNESKIYCTDESHTAGNAIRVAFVENKIGGKSTVFDNATSIEFVENNMAVANVDANGEPLTNKCATRAFNEFNFGNAEQNTLFHIEAGEELNITMNIWLEGTDKHCTSSVLNLSDLNIFIKFSTSYEDIRTLYFIDHTIEKWVDDTDCYVFAIDEHNVHHRMTKSDNYDNDYTWSVDLPTSVESVKFVRYNPDKDAENERQWNYWPEADLGTCTTYNAFGHSAGMWSESFSSTTITLFDGTPSGFLTNKGDDNKDIVMHVAFSIKDGNNNDQTLDYKLSYQYEEHRWQIVIPSSVSNISFKRYDSTEQTVYNSWNNTVRGTNLYYTTTASGQGYWSNRILFLDDTYNLKSDAAFAACFYSEHNDKYVPTDGVWSAMRATNDNGRYIVAVPNGKTHVAFCRAKPDVASYDINNTQNIYNRTEHQYNKFEGNNLFKLMGYWDNNSYYMWGEKWYTTNDGI